MKYKVGDKVRIRKDLEVNTTYGCKTFVNSMCKYRGETTTIYKVLDDYYKLEIDNVPGERWSWSEEMLKEDSILKALDKSYFTIGDEVIIKPGREYSRPGVFTITSAYTEAGKRYYRLNDNDTVGWDQNNFIKIPVFLVGQVVTFKNVEDDRWPHSTDIDGELGMIASIDVYSYAPNKPGEDGNRYHVRSFKTGVCWYVTSASIELVPTVASLEDIKSVSQDDPGLKGDLGIIATAPTTAEALAQAVDNIKGPRFKIGDRVLIREDLVPGKKYEEWDYSPEDGMGGWEFAAAMAKYMGKVATITGCVADDPNYCHLDIDKGTYSWIVNSLLPYTPGSDYDLDKQIINQQTNNNRYENQLQRKEEPLIGGCECTGTGVCYPGEQVATCIGHLGYRKIAYRS